MQLLETPCFLSCELAPLRRGAAADGASPVTFEVAALPSFGELFDVTASGEVGAVALTSVGQGFSSDRAAYKPGAHRHGGSSRVASSTLASKAPPPPPSVFFFSKI